ncbi:MAG: triacylglycerol lipase [Chlamydiales bacterium]|jgi:triacylglycerol lipase
MQATSPFLLKSIHRIESFVANDAIIKADLLSLPIRRAVNCINRAKTEGSEEDRELLTSREIYELFLQFNEKSQLSGRQINTIPSPSQPGITQWLWQKKESLYQLLSTAYNEVYSLSLLSIRYPRALFNSGPALPMGENKRKQAILLVHGYLHNKSGWSFIKSELQKSGFGPIYTINLTPLHGSIENFSEQLAEKVLSIQEEIENKSLVLIGHSMGGLVCAYYAENIAREKQVSHIITIGSPLRGTKLAALGIGHCTKQMRYGSKFTQKLNRQIINNESIKYFHIASKTDKIIYPYLSSLTNRHLDRQLLLNGHGHTSLITCAPEVPENIIGWLSSDN